ncbi:hypothetical protein PI126_g6370 [Phytophthora idaei]|nr:hypothetical protein PI126_g6370 [Phytophthora idaei]
MLLVAPRRCLRVGALQLAPAPIHLVSSSTPRLQCKREGVRFFSSDPPAYGVPSVAVPFSDTVWEKTVNPALRTFLKLRNHAMVPISFVVPTDDDRWAEETRGYPLGKHAEWLRRRWRARKELPKFTVEDLKELDFAFDWSQYKWNHFVKPALRRYYELNEHTDVPQLFRIEHGDAEWPEKLWGYFLGPRVFNIRHRGDFKVQIEEDAQEMAEINFCYDSTTKGYFAEQVARDDAELKTVEFVWDHSFTEWNDRIFPALETFKRKKGHCHVMKYFVVPSTESWPEKSHGLKLGTVINNIRSYSNYFDRTARNVDRLASVGFDLQIAQLKWDRRVEPMLDTFEELHGHRNVPTDFVVPSEAPWQKSDWGIHLGKLKLKGKYM